MKVKFNNLFLQNKPILNQTRKILNYSIKNSKFIGGKEILVFEKKFAKLTNSKYCITVANGTDALIISLKSLNIKQGDEVITTAHTWVSTAGAIIAVGATPVFVDTDEFYTINVKKIEKKITKKTKAIIPVHLYGQSCEMDKLMRIANKYNLKVIEDCAQAHLSKYKGKILGNFGDTGTFSFFPGKNLGSIGDAGAIICNKKQIYDFIIKYKNHGSLKKNNHKIFGLNSRMDNIHASFLTQKMKYLNNFNSKREKIAKKYNANLSRNKFISLPMKRKNSYHSYHQYVIKVNKSRNKLIDFLKKKKIDTSIHYPKMIINLLPYKKFARKRDFKNCIKDEREILSLPMHPFLTNKEIDYICKNINNFFKI